MNKAPPSNIRAAALGLLAGLMAAPGLRAATYYVDFAGGSDANDGTAAAAPFQHCPGDDNARDQAARAEPAPGDTVIFKGGVTYLGAITCGSSGVTYDGGAAGKFGAGPAIFSGQNRRATIRGMTATGRTDLVFRHLEWESYGGHGSTPWSGRETRGYFGYALYLDGCSHVRVEHCTFHDIGDWQNAPDVNEGYMEGIGVAVIDSGSAISIADNEFTRIGRAGVMIEPKLGSRVCTGISITGNDFHSYLRWGVQLATGNADCTLSGVMIEGNRFHDFYQYNDGAWRGLRGDSPHVDCIIAYIGNMPPQGGQTLGTRDRPITIRNNFFYNDAVVPAVQNAAVSLDTWGGRVLVYNNVFINTLYNGNGAIFCLEGTDTSINPAPDYWIVNNSFFDTTYGVTLESLRFPLRNGSVRILNNIFAKADASAGYSVRVMDPDSAPAELDYDLYFTRRPDHRLAHTPAGYLTLSSLRAAGYELHGRQADPGFLNVAAGLGTASSANDLHLRASSPAIAGGANLSGLFSTDRDGTRRPPSPTAWDDGAYQRTGP